LPIAFLLLGMLSTATASGGAVAPQPGMLLVARQELPDIRFRETVVLVVQHDPRGTAGLILNRPSRLALAEVLPALPQPVGLQGTLSYGGPVAPGALMVLIRGGEDPPDSGQKVFASVYLTVPEHLSDWLAKEPDARYRVFTGYAGWVTGQLEGEMARGDWQVLPSDERILFSPDVAGLWQELSGHEPKPAR
jgi:putative transcriptional regulator